MYYVRMDKYVEAVSKTGRPLKDFHKGMKIRGAHGMSLNPSYTYVLEEDQARGLPKGLRRT